MRHRRYGLWAIAVCLCPGVLLAGDVPNPKKPYDLTTAKTYSNVCFHGETGDVLGLRIFVRAKGAEPRVVGQYAEGALTAPFAVRSTVAGARLTFVLPGDSPEVTLNGEVFDRYVLVRSQKVGDKALRLDLRDDTKGFPTCR